LYKDYDPWNVPIHYISNEDLEDKRLEEARDSGLVEHEQEDERYEADTLAFRMKDLFLR
jgi:hypothetical protein